MDEQTFNQGEWNLLYMQISRRFLMIMRSGMERVSVVSKWRVRGQSDLWTLTSFGNTFPVNNNESYLRGRYDVIWQHLTKYSDDSSIV